MIVVQCTSVYCHLSLSTYVLPLVSGSPILIGGPILSLECCNDMLCDFRSIFFGLCLFETGGTTDSLTLCNVECVALLLFPLHPVVGR